MNNSFFIICFFGAAAFGGTIRPVYLSKDPPPKCRPKRSWASCIDLALEALEAFDIELSILPEKDDRHVFTIPEILRIASIWKAETNQEDYQCVMANLRDTLNKVYLIGEAVAALIEMNQKWPSIGSVATVTVSNEEFLSFWSTQRHLSPALRRTYVCDTYFWYKAVIEQMVDRPVKEILLVDRKTERSRFGRSIGVVAVPPKFVIQSVLRDTRASLSLGKVDINGNPHDLVNTSETSSKSLNSASRKRSLSDYDNRRLSGEITDVIPKIGNGGIINKFAAISDQPTTFTIPDSNCELPKQSMPEIVKGSSKAMQLRITQTSHAIPNAISKSSKKRFKQIRSDGQYIYHYDNPATTDAVVHPLFLEDTPPSECVTPLRSRCPKLVAVVLSAMKVLALKVPEDKDVSYNTSDVLDAAGFSRPTMSQQDYNCVKSAIVKFLLRVYLVKDAFNMLVQLNQSSNHEHSGDSLASYSFKQMWISQLNEYPMMRYFSSLCSAYYFYKAVFEPRVGQPIGNIILGTTVVSSVKQAGSLVVPKASSVVALIKEMQQRWKLEAGEDSTHSGKRDSGDGIDDVSRIAIESRVDDPPIVEVNDLSTNSDIAGEQECQDNNSNVDRVHEPNVNENILNYGDVNGSKRSTLDNFEVRVAELSETLFNGGSYTEDTYLGDLFESLFPIEHYDNSVDSLPTQSEIENLSGISPDLDNTDDDFHAFCESLLR